MRRPIKLAISLWVVVLEGCSSTASSSTKVVEETTSTKKSGSAASAESVDVKSLCKSVEGALSAAGWREYGVDVTACDSSTSDNGDNVFMLKFNDPEEWTDLYLAFGDIAPEDGARYVFWRMPLGLLSVGFTIAEQSPNDFDQIVIFFENPKQTAYDVLPRDIAYVLDIPDSLSKEEYSTELNKRIDEVSERVDVYNLSE
jgi:hypothetical protein